MPNQEKSASEFDEWLKKTYPDKPERAGFCQKHYVPDCDLALENLKEFFEERKALLKQELVRILKG
jgi:hypothetical protein